MLVSGSLPFSNIHRRNWPEKDNTWEPYGHVAKCRDILEEFEARYTRYFPEHNMMCLGQEVINFGSFNPFVEDGQVGNKSFNSLALSLFDLGSVAATSMHSQTIR